MAKRDRDLQITKIRRKILKIRSNKKNGRRYKSNGYKCELRKDVLADM
jgi:hypothetical protein